MKITGINVLCVPMSYSWLTERRIANPMSPFPRYVEKRSSWFGKMVAGVVQISTEEGIQGLGFIGGGKAQLASTIIEDQLKIFLIGQDPFNVELLWEQMYRSSVMYGRRGVVIEAISGIDIALWDIIGKATGQPVYRLIGGKTKEQIKVYATGNDSERHKRLGFTGVKLAVPYGPADGEEGMRKNENLLRETREIMGEDAEIMLDCYMAWDVPYTIEMARRLMSYRIKWIEEPVLPDHVDSYLRIKEAVKDILITGGEHEFTRFGFKSLIERHAVDVLQPDIYRAGGISELKKISAWASAYDLPVIPHGVGAPTYHLVMSNTNSPAAEYVDIFAEGGEWILSGDPVPVNGMIELSDRPGFGYELNENVLSGRVNPVPIW